MGSAICGGVIPYSKFKKEPMAYMMAFVMKDRYYNWFIAAKKRGDNKRVKELFDKYARSQI